MSTLLLPLLRRFSLLFLSVFSLATMLGQSPPPSSQRRIMTAVDERSLVNLPGNTHSFALARFDQGPAPISMPAGRLILVLKRSAMQEADLQTYLASVQDPSSSSYHKFLSPEDFGARFGVGDADLQTIQAWLASHGMKVNRVSKARTALEIAGTVGQVQDAFHTSIHSYRVGGTQYWANTADPQIPEALSPIVAGLASMSSFKPAAQFIRGPSGRYDPAKNTITPTYTFGSAQNGYYIFLGPADAATIYDTPTSLNPNFTGTKYDGTGVTIGIAGDSNIDVTQNANYRATFGLPAKATKVTVDGTDPGENGDAIEAYLDTEVSGGIAPGANVILYTAANTTLQSGLFLAVARALDDNQADILNVSFGACEAEFGAAGNQYINSLWEQAAAQGIAVTVSTGDSGSAGCDNPDTEQVAQYGLAVNGIASTPYDIAVGGTDFDALYANFPTSFTNYVNVTNTLANHRSALKYIPEEPWNDSTASNTTLSANIALSYYGAADNIVAGGGGVSTTYPLPSWQTSNASATGRNLPDVSFLAGNGFYGAAWGLCTDQDYDQSTGTVLPDCAGTPTTGASFYLTGIGGTSAAAPAFAGILALLQQEVGSRLGQVDYVLYGLAKSKYSTVFHDVTTGDNSVSCQASTPNCTPDTLNFEFLSGYNATTGYDNASGLGSVDAAQLLNSWSSAGLVGTSASLKLNGATTAISITHGQSVTVNASVTSTSGTPAGNVELVDSLSPATLPNNGAIADFTLASGSVSGSTSELPGGSYNVSAHYGGSNTYAESDSNSIPVTVGAETSTTSLKVVGYYDPSTGQPASTPYYGYIYLLDAQPYGNSASASSPNGNATGTITFKSGTSTLGTAAIASNGVAELQTTQLPGGTDSLTAVFPGDASFQASTGAPLSFSVTPAVTTMSLSVLPPIQTFTAGTAISFNVNFSTDSAGAAPTGTVTFQNGSTVVGTATVTGTAGTSKAPAAGAASFSSSNLLPGTYNVTAVYGGDGNYAQSSLTAAPFTIQKQWTQIGVTPASTTVIENQALQVVVTPAPVSGLPTPTGTVTLSYNGSPGTTPPVSLVNGTATVTIPANSLIPGIETITANYSGDSVFVSNSAWTLVTVNGSGTLVPMVTVVGPTTTQNLPVSLTVNVTGPSGDPVPTGLVMLTTFDMNPRMTLTNGSATFTFDDGLGNGPNNVTASYFGDTNYTTGTGTAAVNLFAVPQYSFTPQSPIITVDQPLSTTVTLTGVANYPTPTGTLTLTVGSYSSGPLQLTSGAASFAIPANSLPVGNDMLTASYSGDSYYSAGANTEYVMVNATQPASFTAAATSVSLAPGATTNNTSTITLTPAGGFTGSVTLTASITSSPAGAVDLPTFSFGTTNPVSITDTNSKTATMTVSTTAATSALLHRPASPGAGLLGGGGVLACILLFGSSRQRRRWKTLLGMLVFIALLGGGMLSCGGGGGSGGGGGTGNPGTTPGTYRATVTGTSGSTTAQCTVTIQVQ